MSLVASAQLYQPGTGYGIRLAKKKTELWDRGALLSTGPAVDDAWKYFSAFAFREMFPEIEFWWWGSAWTQQVRLTSPQGTLPDGQTLWGYMQFTDAGASLGIYSITDAVPAEVTVPLPPGVGPLNLPLRVILAKLALGILEDEVAPNEWLPVSSLVAKADLEKAFMEGENWVLADLPAQGLMNALLVMQGLTPPAQPK